MSLSEAPPIQRIDIDAGGIRVVCAPIAGAPSWVQTELLSDDERSRAARYRRPAHGLRFSAARCVLRTVLGAELGVAPQEVPLRNDADGRPYVSGGPDFNLSHCDDTVLIAIAPPGVRVGVDIEPLDRDVDPDTIAARLLHPTEGVVFESLDASARRLLVLRTWVWKEAYAKCTGEGIRLDLRQLTLDSDGRVLRNNTPSHARTMTLPLGPAHASALCWTQTP